MGTEWLMGDKLAFLNVTETMLTSEFMELLPAKRIVLEIQGDIHPTPALLERLQGLQTLGFAFALHMGQINSENDALIKFASYVKVDLLSATLDRLGDIAAKLKSTPEKLPGARFGERRHPGV